MKAILMLIVKCLLSSTLLSQTAVKSTIVDGIVVFNLEEIIVVDYLVPLIEFSCGSCCSHLAATTNTSTPTLQIKIPPIPFAKPITELMIINNPKGEKRLKKKKRNHLNLSLSCYPNPAVDNLNVQLEQDVDHLILRNIIGNEIQRYNKVLTSVKTIDVSSLPVGTYLLQAVKGDLMISKKVIELHL